MKILLLTMSFGSSGGMRVISKLANEWAKAGNSVDILVVYNSEPYFDIDAKVSIVRITANNNKDARRQAISFIKEHNEEYDAYIATYWVTAYILNKALKNNEKAYYYIQAYEPEFYKRGNPKQVVKRILSWNSYNLGLTKIVNSDIYCNYKNIHTDKAVYPGLDLSLYWPKTHTVSDRILRIGTIGRTEEHKGTSDVCKAMEILASDGIEFEYYIAFNDYETIPHHFVKPDGDENLSAFYRDMDIVVAACKGQHGAIHYPIIEAMAVGTTIVCTDYYPSDSENSYKVDESSPEQIATQIKHIIDNRDEAIKKSEQALKDVQQFDWPIVAKKFLGFLQEE